MDSIVFGLNISDSAKKIASDVIESSDKEFIKMGISRIVQNYTNYEDFCLAGRLVLYQIVKTIRNVETYVALNHQILSDHISSYLLEHSVILNKVLLDNEKYNYVNQDFFSAETLAKNYLLKAVCTKEATETPLLHHLRIATQMYYEVGIDRVLQAFHEMKECYYTHASPTKFHAGTKKPQMASCFLMGVADCLPSMMYTGIGDMAIISSNAGGIGIGLNEVRHSDIAGTGNSAGAVAYARVCDSAVGYVDQSRRRRGAATGYLNVWHIDILEFIQSASNHIQQDLRLVDLTPCVWAHDLFFERCINNQEWTLFCPNTVPDLKGKYGDSFEKEYLRYEALAENTERVYESANMAYDAIRQQIAHIDEPPAELLSRFTQLGDELRAAKKNLIVRKVVKARNILESIGDIQGKSGKPYVMNGDRCNFKSNQQNLGPINNSNLCVEIVQFSNHNTFSSCNLASLNLPRFARGRLTPLPEESSQEEIMTALHEVYDFETLGKVTRSVVSNIDKVITYNYYSLDKSKIEDLNMKTRPLGIGISGLDDAFKVLDLVYGSRESIILNKMIFACMYYNALSASVDLAISDGEYPLFRTGEFTTFDFETNSMKTYQGSPMANGMFQFDLWDREYHHDLFLGRVNKMYDPDDNIPVDPKYFGGGSWHDLRDRIIINGLRNSLLIALMPTASTAQVLRNAESVEAHQSNMYAREVGKGSYTIINRHLQDDLRDLGLLNKEVMDYIYNNEGRVDGLDSFIRTRWLDLGPEVHTRVEYLLRKYQTMFDIKPSLFLKMARQRGIYVDQSQSTNIYILDPTPAQLAAVQMVGYYNKLKTHVYYTRRAVSTANTGFNKKVDDAKSFDSSGPACQLRPDGTMSCCE